MRWSCSSSSDQCLQLHQRDIRVKGLSNSAGDSDGSLDIAEDQNTHPGESLSIVIDHVFDGFMTVMDNDIMGGGNVVYWLQIVQWICFLITVLVTIVMFIPQPGVVFVLYIG